MNKTKITWQWFSVVLLVITVLAGPAIAGNLNPSAPPGPTMKTLDQTPAKDEVIPPWSQTLPASERFKLVFGGAAVLDKETGLVWEQSPDTNRKGWDVDWSGEIGASGYCYYYTIGGRKGWRLPKVEELASLFDSSVQYPGLALPSGHPFSNVQPSSYWTSTTFASDATKKWVVVFFGGGGVGSASKGDRKYVWCVRGGDGSDEQ